MPFKPRIIANWSGHRNFSSQEDQLNPNSCTDIQTFTMNYRVTSLLKNFFETMTESFKILFFNL